MSLREALRSCIYGVILVLHCVTALVAAQPGAEADDDDASTVTDTGDANHAAVRPHIDLLPGLTLNTLLQVRYVNTFHRGSDNPQPGYALREDYLVNEGDGFVVRRAYLRMNAEPTDFFKARLVVDVARFERGGLGGSIRQAWGRIGFIPKHVELSAGVLKLPLSIMKLDSSSELEVADNGPLTELVTDLDYAGRDVGVSVMLAPFDKSKLAQLTVGAYRGHAYDEHASPVGALAARIESHPVKGLRLGLSAQHQPYEQHYKRPFETSDRDVLPMPSDPLYPRERSWSKGTAYAADATYHRRGLMVRAEGILGDRVDSDVRYGARSFAGAWALLSYKFAAGSVDLQPAARAEWLDVDMDHDIGTRLTLSLAIAVLLSEHVRMLLDATHVEVQAQSPFADPPRPMTEIPYFEIDHTRVTGQLQIEI